MMHKKRAFVHWLLREGMTEEDILDAIEDLSSL